LELFSDTVHIQAWKC